MATNFARSKPDQASQNGGMAMTNPRAMGRALSIVVLALATGAGCRYSMHVRSDVLLSNPVSFETAHSEEHVVGHEAGTCDLCDLYYKARTHVVRLRAGEGMGTGFVVSKSGRILTHAHGVDDRDAPTVETYEGQTFAATILRSDGEVDLALLQADPPSVDWAPMQVQPVSLPDVGSDVYVFGHPVGLGWTITRGIVSALRKAGEVAPTEIIQTDAAISPGNSGGPLLDRDGRLQAGRPRR